MSGGHFCDGYPYYKVSQFADELEEEIKENFIKDDWGYYKGFSQEILNCMRYYLPQMRKIAEVMRACDYLYAGDYGEDSFMRSIKNIEEKYD